MLVTWTRAQAPPTLGGALDMHDGHPAETGSTGREIARLLSLTRRDGPTDAACLATTEVGGKRARLRAACYLEMTSSAEIMAMACRPRTAMVNSRTHVSSARRSRIASIASAFASWIRIPSLDIVLEWRMYLTPCRAGWRRI